MTAGHHGRRLPRPMGHALRALAAQAQAGHDAPLNLNQLDIAALTKAATFHRLLAPLHLATRNDSSMPAATAATLLDAYRDGIGRHLRASSTLATVADALRGIRWVVFKGPALVACYQRPDLRRYFDLDLLVHPATLGSSVHALEAAGFTVLDRNWVFIDEQRIGEIHLMSPDGVPVDLHHDLVYNDTRRSRYRVSGSEALERAVQVPVSGGAYPTFCAEDAVLHLVLHASLAGADRLGWLLDIDQTVRARSPDWALVAARATDWGLSLASHVVLHRCVHLLGTPVPRAVLRELATNPAWRTMVETSQWWSGVQRATGGPSWSRTLARVAVSDLNTSVRLLGSGIARTLTRRGHVDRRDGSADDSTALAFDAGGIERREAFFARLAAEQEAPGR